MSVLRLFVLPLPLFLALFGFAKSVALVLVQGMHVVRRARVVLDRWTRCRDESRVRLGLR